jgi:hypothetical protein
LQEVQLDGETFESNPGLGASAESGGSQTLWLPLSGASGGGLSGPGRPPLTAAFSIRHPDGMLVMRFYHADAALRICMPTSIWYAALLVSHVVQMPPAKHRVGRHSKGKQAEHSKPNKSAKRSRESPGAGATAAKKSPASQMPPPPPHKKAAPDTDVALGIHIAIYFSIYACFFGVNISTIYRDICLASATWWPLRSRTPVHTTSEAGAPGKKIDSETLKRRKPWKPMVLMMKCKTRIRHHFAGQHTFRGRPLLDRYSTVTRPLLDRYSTVTRPLRDRYATVTHLFHVVSIFAWDLGTVMSYRIAIFACGFEI